MSDSIYIAEIRISDRIERKINEKHSVTLAEVKEAFILRNDVRSGWEDHPTHGPRVVAIGTTATGRLLIAAFYEIDARDGAWALATARQLKH